MSDVQQVLDELAAAIAAQQTEVRDSARYAAKVRVSLEAKYLERGDDWLRREAARYGVASAAAVSSRPQRPGRCSRCGQMLVGVDFDTVDEYGVPESTGCAIRQTVETCRFARAIVTYKAESTSKRAIA